MSLFLKSSSVEILSEDFSETMDSFISYAERKMKGYSVREIDLLANKAKHLNSEVSKRELLERIEEALKDARSAMNKSIEAKKKELRLQIQVLSELKTKVESFKVIDHHDPEEKKDEKDKINLDDR